MNAWQQSFERLIIYSHQWLEISYREDELRVAFPLHTTDEAIRFEKSFISQLYSYPEHRKARYFRL